MTESFAVWSNLWLEGEDSPHYPAAERTPVLLFNRDSSDKIELVGFLRNLKAPVVPIEITAWDDFP
jgi:hypothetical protein